MQGTKSESASSAIQRAQQSGCGRWPSESSHEHGSQNSPSESDMQWYSRLSAHHTHVHCRRQCRAGSGASRQRPRPFSEALKTERQYTQRDEHEDEPCGHGLSSSGEMASPPPLDPPPPPLLRVRERGVASEVWMQHGEGEPLPVSCGEPPAEDEPGMALGMQVGEEE